MSEKRLTNEQQQRIEEIKRQWADEMGAVLDKREKEENLARHKNAKAPRILDKHLKETVEIEKKYKEIIKKVVEE